MRKPLFKGLIDTPANLYYKYYAKGEDSFIFVSVRRSDYEYWNIETDPVEVIDWYVSIGILNIIVKPVRKSA